MGWQKGKKIVISRNKACYYFYFIAGHYYFCSVLGVILLCFFRFLLDAAAADICILIWQAAHTGRKTEGQTCIQARWCERTKRATCARNAKTASKRAVLRA